VVTDTSTTNGRQKMIVRAAIELFRQKGYHGAGIAELGGTVGVTGPAIYRHFESKADILVEAIIEGSTKLAEGARNVDPGAAPVERLRALISSYVDVAAADPDLIAVYLLESRHLPPSGRQRLTRRVRRHVSTFVDAVCEHDVSMSRDDATLLVQAVLGMPALLCLRPERITRSGAALLKERMLDALLGSTKPTT
jgi:AcrR family transcriptional regulator